MTVSLEEITLRNQAESPLLRLPGELRNRIYELAVGGNIIVVSSSYKRWRKMSVYLTSADPSGPDAKSAQASIRAPVSDIFTIGLVCRQLHRETALIQYAKNLFHLDNIYYGRDFVDSLSSAQRALVTSISVRIGTYFVARWFNSYPRKDLDMPSLFLPQVERVYISPEHFKSHPWSDEETLLKVIGHNLKIGTGRKEGISVMVFDVFQGMENRDQAKTIKLGWDGEAFV
ncbi:hypothetical protein J4E83_007996 [Alternaria metachromatica]|uniref:uncharacterized protein n=1 Tax=Alternaria metachromatica TaxID=283354 RepID=UPI0020C1C710|nr:uncharacterized protein J4E83_007996 [Alternaria metachromatica]KAI4611745.1 hypothetical protein J4E83_007996 [Alternaria metachromatica]